MSNDKKVTVTIESDGKTTITTTTSEDVKDGSLGAIIAEEAKEWGEAVKQEAKEWANVIFGK